MSGWGFSAAIVLAFSVVASPAPAIGQPVPKSSSPPEIRFSTANALPIADELRAQVNTIAGHLTHFATRAIITNRPLRAIEFPADVAAEQAQLVAELKNLGHDPDELHRLLNDPNPQVRTIALGALFVREDPHDLPTLRN
jgi:HEAT repeat protein